jgi:hypothetical protein
MELSMKIKFILSLACLSMLVLSCDFFSGTVYINDNVYLCNFSSDCPPNNVCVGFHIQWDASLTGKPITNSVYSGYYGSCISESKTNNEVFACDNGTSDPSDDLCNKPLCKIYATPVCSESLLNSCGNGVKDYNEECEYDTKHFAIYNHDNSFGQGINCGNFFYNLKDQSSEETNYRLFTDDNYNPVPDDQIYCNPDCTINPLHCSNIQALFQSEYTDQQEELLTHLRHADNFCTTPGQVFCSGPYIGICLNTDNTFYKDFLLPLYEEKVPGQEFDIQINADVGGSSCLGEDAPYCSYPQLVSYDDATDTYELSMECSNDPNPDPQTDCGNGSLNIVSEQCDDDKFDGGSMGVLHAPNAVCNIYGYNDGGQENEVTCNSCSIDFAPCILESEAFGTLGSACLPGKSPCEAGLICKNFIKGDINGNFVSHILPGGYCTTDNPEVCGNNGEDEFFSDFNICMQGCLPGECLRPNHECRPFPGSTGAFCLPNF